jgi:SpoVK/Ycf46/Vps4 family AAA+-type ATPase
MTSPTPVPYASNAEHLRDELRWLECLVRREILISRGAENERQDPLRGMYISDREVDRLAQQDAAQSPDAGGSLEQASAIRAGIEARKTVSADVRLALPHLAGTFGLAPFEERVVLAVLAPELDGRFGTLYAYLQNDVARRRPSIDLILRVLCDSAEQRMSALDAFSHDSTLLRLSLLRLIEKTDEPTRFWPVALDEPIQALLMGRTALIPDHAAVLRVLAADHELAALRWPPEQRKQLLDLIVEFLERGVESRRRLVLHFFGPAGTGKRALAASLCREVGVPLLRLDLREAVARFEDFEAGLRALFRQALLCQSALFLENFDVLTGEDERRTVQRQIVRRTIDEFAWLIFVGTEKPWSAGGFFHPHWLATFELAAPGLVERRRLWEEIAVRSALQSLKIESGVSWADLAVKFRVTPGEMEAALETAAGAARLRNPTVIAISNADLHRGLYAQSNQKLSTLGRKLKPRYTWPDIILPPNALAQLRELCAQICHRETVYEDWGFDRKLSLGKGLCALFSGQSGVGKTMAVEVIANELRLEVFKIDLSNVVSKYIGETEKNLARVFEEAECSNAILFFDEADALFGKRSEVKDAHDRYANIEINYLLQRMEEFEGLVILATNLRKNVDDGFFRRMQFVIDFPFPDVAHRYRIWQHHFPPEAPAEDIDFGYLAERFALSGGNIKNIVVNAAFLAAQNGRVIRMEHLIHATRREYEKAGRLCTESDFAPYQALVAAEGVQ